jgi:flavin-dependent dehydrogenase
LLIEDKQVRGLSVWHKGSTDYFTALVTIDATGRSRCLARQFDNNGPKKPAPFIAFQAHVKGTRLERETCEIYFYPGGYGGFSIVERGLYNACFLVSTPHVKAKGSDVQRVVNEVVCKNARAAYTFGAIEPVSDWIAVALDQFGHRDIVPAYGLLTVGDAAAFIDPFTGSGILMALESGELVASTVAQNLESIKKGDSFGALAQEYVLLHRNHFNSRLRMSGLLRRAAFIPQLAEVVIFLVGASNRLRRGIARATHRSSIDG